MSKTDPQFDVLVLGGHPAAFLAASLLVQAKLKVVHATLPNEREVDRLVIVNPELFSLHPLLEGIRLKLDLTGVYGAQFLADDPEIRSEHRSKSAMTTVGSYRAIREAMAATAKSEGVELISPRDLQIHRLDETGIDLTAGKTPLRPRAMVVAGILPEAQQRQLGLPDSWGPDIIQRYTYIRLNSAKYANLGARPLIPMSLNLKDSYAWGWLLPGPKGLQIAVAQPLDSLVSYPALELLSHWINLLRAHGVLSATPKIDVRDAEFIDLPLAGALAHEGVANRTLLIGPAGGFYSACSEDIYPNCWSAVFAADTLKKALKEKHLQDALQPYRHRWRTSLGEYLRGPQQNLRFLLPLVYRKQIMTTRLTESILLGKSVVRPV